MRGKLILLTILFLGFVGFVLVKFFFLDSAAVTGQIKVSSSPASSVFIDNVASGKTPYESKVKPGTHELKLIPLGDATSTASFAHNVDVDKNTLTYLNVELGSSDISTAAEVFSVTKMKEKPKNSQEGEIEVETDPPGAIVSLDGEEKGTASLILSEVASGNHELSVNLPTFFPRTQKVHVEPGFRVKAFFKLAIDQAQEDKKNEMKKKVEEKTKTQEKTTETEKILIIDETATGWLRVREDASVSSEEVAKVDPGDEYKVLEEKSGWYKIEYEKGKSGWVSSEFVTIKGEKSSSSEEKESTESAQ